MIEKPIPFSAPMVQAILEGRKSMTRRVIKPQSKGIMKIPYHDGDRLYVREPLKRIDWADGIPGIAYAADDEPAWDVTRPCRWVWKNASLPSMFMPKALTRIWLDVTGVRVERVQEITPEDCYAEGIVFVPIGEKRAEDEWAIAKYAHLWDSLNLKRGSGWEANPWVEVVEFKRVEGRP